MASHLQALKPRSADKKYAAQKRAEAILQLAKKHRLSCTEEKANAWSKAIDTRRQAAYLAYTQSVIDRINGAYVDTYALVLWRDIAWKPTGSPIKGFSYELEDITKAQQALLGKIGNEKN